MQATATATGSAIWPSLVFIMGEERRSFVLQSPAFSVGRKADKDLTLLNPRVSRDHAMIVREGDGYFVQDQDSKHGTYVNGERVIRHKLQPNDRIEFGVRGEGHLLFSPDAEASTSARDFLSRIGDRRPSQNISDLEMLTLYLEAARKLNTGGVLGDVLVTLIDALLRLTRSERGYVFLRNEDGSFRLAAGRDEKGQALTEDSTISHSIVKEAVTSGLEFLHTDLSDLSRMKQRESVVAQQLRTVICIPLRRANIQTKAPGESQIGAPIDARRDEIIAVLYLDSRKVGGKLSPVSHDILRAIATEAATLVENARLVQSEQAARRYQQELAIAASIQQRLMLVEIPETPFARVSARSIPCTEIGGDFFDVVSTESGLSVVVADVCGKGVSAALLASIIQGMMYSSLTQHSDLCQGVRALNRFLCERNLGEKYATLLVARLRPNGQMEYVNCGHVPPLLISGGVVTALESGNVPVGLFEDAQYEAGYIKFKPGDRFVIVTDGVTEAENEAGDFFSYEQLLAIAGQSAGLNDLFDCVTKFCAGVPLRDDCTVLELCYGRLT